MGLITPLPIILAYVWACWVTCLILCNPMDCSLPSSSVHGVSQAKILEWLPFPSPGDLPDSGIKPASPALQTDSLPDYLTEGSPQLGLIPSPIVLLECAPLALENHIELSFIFYITALLQSLLLYSYPTLFSLLYAFYLLIGPALL